MSTLALPCQSPCAKIENASLSRHGTLVPVEVPPNTACVTLIAGQRVCEAQASWQSRFEILQDMGFFCTKDTVLYDSQTSLFEIRIPLQKNLHAVSLFPVCPFLYSVYSNALY